jgi:hypothetical protein
MNPKHCQKRKNIISRLEEAENVDVNAGIHGSWTMENAKSMLHQFIQMRHIKTHYKFAMQGNSFVAEMSFYVKVRYVVLDRVVDPHSFNADQCCGSGMFIPDPDFYPSRIPDLGPWIPDPKTATKERG